jgi:hypothetical protein
MALDDTIGHKTCYIGYYAISKDEVIKSTVDGDSRHRFFQMGRLYHIF